MAKAQSLSGRFLCAAMLTLAAWIASGSAFATPGAVWSENHPRDKFVGDEALRNVRDPLANHRARADRSNVLRGSFENCPHDYDVLHYDLTFNELNESAGGLDAVTVIDFVSQVDNLTSIDLDLTSQLTVSSVLLDSTTPLAFSHAADVLNVQFVALPDSGDTVSIDVAYSGLPANEGGGGFGGFWFQVVPKNAFSMGVGLDADPPSMGRTWFPGWDWPCDKATVSLHIETNFNRVGVGNGTLVGKDSTATHHTWHWQHDYPGVHLSDRSCRSPSTACSPTRSSPTLESTSIITRKSRSEAPVSFQYTDLMMEAFETRFGPYPYDAFKFMTTTKGDMEHQTCVSHLYTLVDGTNFYDPILAHEMAHMWFGDCVTYGDWRDVWLSEGFATYGEAVFREYQNGTSDYHWFMTNIIMGRVLNSGVTDGLYDPSFKWGVEAYEKGASVLHMLRGLSSTTTLSFGRCLQDYHANHAYGNAVTTDFLADVAATVGQDMSWFFDPWLYGTGHPVYEYGWSWERSGWRSVSGRRHDSPGPGYGNDLRSPSRLPRSHHRGGRRTSPSASIWRRRTVSFVVSDVPTGTDRRSRTIGCSTSSSSPRRRSTSVPTSRRRRHCRWRCRGRTHSASGPRFGTTCRRPVRSRSSSTTSPGARSDRSWTASKPSAPARSGGTAGPRTVTKVAAGVYYMRLEAAEGTRTEKVVVLD